MSMKTPAALLPPASKRPVAVSMPDVQASGDTRQVPIDKVGVKDVTYPIRLRVPAEFAALLGGRDEQTTVATISMYVSLPHYQKGTHMSRFLEVLNQHEAAITPGDIPAMTRAIRERLDAKEAHFEAHFTYFIKKFAPVSGVPGLMDYRVSFECSSGETDDFIMVVKAPATSLCPCSKEISARGAHNQRCLVEARVRMRAGTPMLWIEELVSLLEGAASEQLYAVLKRPDEKAVTEGAYDNPKFVEDIVRDLAIALEAERRIAWYSINSENFESIHNHNAYAKITRKKG